LAALLFLILGVTCSFGAFVLFMQQHLHRWFCLAAAVTGLFAAGAIRVGALRKAMSAAQRKLTIGFSVGIGLTLLWGIGTYTRDCYLDASAPAGISSEVAFIDGVPTLVFAIFICIVLAICFAVCYVCFRTNPAER